MSDRRLRSPRGLVIALAIIGLTISLAGRVPHVRFDVTTAVHSNSTYTKVQHRDKDAFEWVSPVASICLLWVSEYSVTSEPAENPAFRFVDQNLYNRPPPLA